MKQITKEITVWKLDPKRVAVELFFAYGVVRMGMDLWSLLN